jgi:hypothetical protein
MKLIIVLELETKTVLPTEKAPEGFYHGWYSETQANIKGTAIYYNLQGGLVEISEVTESPICRSPWTDKQYVGLLKKAGWRPGRSGKQQRMTV